MILGNQDFKIQDVIRHGNKADQNREKGKAMSESTETMEITTQRKSPWVGIGSSGSWNQVEDAMRACDLDFEVDEYDAQFSWDDDNGITMYDLIPGVKATVRQDNHRPLGCVSPTYHIVQNAEVFSMLQPFVDQGGTITHGGMTNEGLCFMIVDMGNQTIGGDDYTFNIMATNSFNGRYPASLICSPIRIICQNMYRSLMGNTDNVARFRHSLNVNGRLEAIQEAYAMFGNFTGTFDSEVNRLHELTAAHTIDEFTEFLFPYTNTNTDSSRYEASREKVDEKRSYYKNHYYYSDTNIDDGSCFALVNAYYDYISHDVPGKKTEDEYKSRRLSSIVGGTLVKPSVMSYMCESK